MNSETAALTLAFILWKQIGPVSVPKEWMEPVPVKPPPRAKPKMRKARKPRWAV